MRMIIRMKFIIILSILVFGISCTKDKLYLSTKAKTVNLQNTEQNVKLPTALWKTLEEVYRPPALDNTRVEQEGSKTKLALPIEYFKIQVYLKEETRNVLKEDSYQLLFEKGGGELDLLDFVKDSRGVFRMGVVADIEGVEELKDMKVFFLPNSKIKNEASGPIASSCDQYYEITSYFHKSMDSSGFELNTFDQKHLGLVAGSFFFALSHNGKLFLSQLTIKDSRYKNLHCRWQ